MRFRTIVRHKPGTVVELYGWAVKLNPTLENEGDTSGFAEFDVPDDRGDVIERLLEIPEAYEPVDTTLPDSAAKKPDHPESLVIENGTDQVDLFKADKPKLLEIAGDLGLSIHPNTGVEKIRAQVVEAVKAEQAKDTGKQEGNGQSQGQQQTGEQQNGGQQ